MSPEQARAAGTTVKICGLMSVPMIESMLHLPIDHIGFLFAPSKRQVTAELAKDMIEAVRKKAGRRPLTFGVFVNPSMEQLEQLLAVAPLDVVQLHGQETPEFCRQVKDRLPVDVYKVFSVSESASAENAGAGDTAEDRQSAEAIAAQLDPYRGCIDGMLLDTHDPIVGGGTGKAFAWDRIPPYAAWADQEGIPLLVAGGLDADNVQGLISAFRPNGVDVSSGVETNGAKDIAKITAFVERVKRS